ncbi:hypothetical protein ScPMuIL_006649 [Solemya velum]
MEQSDCQYLACSESDIKPGARKRLEVNGRDIFLVNIKGKIYALDSHCYHVGGPLHEGDIEDTAGRTCLVCPWHEYRVRVDTGESLHQVYDPSDDTKPPEWKECGVKQRTHMVKVRNGSVFVTLSDMTQELASDEYNICKQ